MHIVHIATELSPIAKVGGLADVIYGLAKEVQNRGHEVEIILPKYDCMDYGPLKNLQMECQELWSFDGPYRYHNTIWSAQIDGLKLLLLDPHHPSYFFSRGKIYGCPDDIDRFIYFSRAALEYLYKSGRRPDIVHLHDWPTSICAPLYKDMYIPLGLKVGGVVLTIHNLHHQGKCSPHNVTKAGLRGEDYLLPEKMQDPFSLGDVNLLKGGIVYSDFITTVSPTYEQEIKTVSGGQGLDTLLTKNQHKLKGILNGIDPTFWNPATDSHQVAHYSIERPLEIAKAKAENRAHLRQKLKLKEDKGPLIASITRLVPQKGPELIGCALRRTLEKGGQFVLLGTAHSPALEKWCAELKQQFANNPSVAFRFELDLPLSHLLYGAADAIVIPSIFEPCGLTQLIALRYGTVPIVRKTGGLADTVFDIDNSTRPEQDRNGFLFDFPDPAGVNWAIDRAIDCYVKTPKKWQKIVKQGMNQDYSWRRPADEYIKIYQQLCSRG